jgi:hypothetical protein
MLEAWLSAVMLAVESSEVVSLRMMKISQGGGDAYSEAALMLREKVAAGVEAQKAIWSGDTISSVIERYREHVAANAKRLTA